MINVEARKESNETTGSLLRRFGKKIGAANVLKKAKRLQARERPPSHYKKKKAALHRLRKRAEMNRLRKLGKIV